MQNNNTGATASNWAIKDTLFPEAQAHALKALAEGKSDKEIARERGISPDGAYNIFRRLRSKWGTKKRSALVAEAIARGIISPIMVLICIASVLSGMVSQDFEMRRTSNRLNPRTFASRTVRAKREGLAVDFEFSDMTPDSLLAFFEATPAMTNTIAPWSSAAWMQRDLLENSERLELWRSQIEVLAQAA